MQKLEDFRLEFIKECSDEALLDTISVEEAFINKVIEKLKNSDELEDFSHCFFEKTLKNKNARIDGYHYDTVDYSFNLFISDYVGDENIISLTNVEWQKSYKKVRTFIEHSLDGFIVGNIEESTPAYGLSSHLNEEINNITKFKVYILTDKVLSQRVKKIDVESIENIPVEIKIWDAQRMFELYESKQQKEKIIINFEDLGVKGLRCLKACETDNYSSYLTMISGTLLSELYLYYGASLLEGNVRSFLSTRGKVNKAIRKTILTEPKMFFAFNNGIAATADKGEFKIVNGELILQKIVNLQIINGGQTTASLANAIIKDKAQEQMKDIMVPVKLSIVEEENALKLIPKISRTANMQNKVSDADFFSNHPYHIRIEEYSRKVYAPEKMIYDYKTKTTQKADTRTKWYYERARGQYDQEQMKKTTSERIKFKKLHPTAQLLKKTDWAKYLNTFECKPQIVSKGAQFNMNKFAEYISKKWDQSNTSNQVYNEVYYKNSICYAIMYKETEKIVSNTDWYKQIKSYRANIVTYSLAYLTNYINNNFPNKTFNFNKMWSNQNVTTKFRNQIESLSKEVYEFITREDRGTLNVTEWCKKDLCWMNMKEEKFTIHEEYISSLIDKNVIKEIEKEAKKERRTDNNLAVEIEVCSLGSAFWKKLKNWALERKLLNATEISLIDIACNLERRMPNAKQSQRIMEIKERIMLEGFLA